MLTKTQHQLERRIYWKMAKLNLIATARRLGYKKGSLTKGVARVRVLLSQMGIAVF